MLELIESFPARVAPLVRLRFEFADDGFGHDDRRAGKAHAVDTVSGRLAFTGRTRDRR